MNIWSAMGGLEDVILEMVDSFDAIELTTLRGNRPLASIQRSEVPALITEIDEGSLEAQAGHRQMLSGYNLMTSLVFHEADHHAAVAFMAAIVGEVIRAVMNNPTLKDTVPAAWVSGWQTDRGGNHPFHIARFTVRVDDEVIV